MTARRARVLMTRHDGGASVQSASHDGRRTPSHGAVTAGLLHRRAMSLSYASPAVVHSSLDLLPPAAERRGRRARRHSSTDARSMARSWSTPVTCADRSGRSRPEPSGPTSTSTAAGSTRGGSAWRTATAATWRCSPGSATVSVGRPSVARRHGIQLPVVEGLGTGHSGRHRRLRRAPRPRRPDRARRLRPGDVLGCRSDDGRGVPPCAVQRPG